MKKILILMMGVIMYAMNLQAPGFGEKISLKYVYSKCGGENISPELIWSDFPKNTKSFAITMFDPDAPTDHGWWHWMVTNIPLDVTHFPQNAGSPQSPYFNLGFQSVNDYGEIGYGGPCPPAGEVHRYIITVYALDVPGFQIDREINPQSLSEAIKEHTIQSASVMGYYQRGWE